MSVQKDSPITINKGTCYAMFAYDIGSSINLSRPIVTYQPRLNAAACGIKPELHSISNIALRRSD